MAHDCCNLRALIGQKGRDRPSSLHTRRWRPIGLKKTSWMKKSTWSPTCELWIRFCGLLKFSSGPPPRDGPDAHSRRPWIFLIFFSNRFKGIFHNRFEDIQTPSSGSLKLVEFEKYYIKPNPPFFFRQQIMRWSCNMVHPHFTLCLRVHDYIKRISQHPRYGLWMRVKGPHHYKVTALGLCVKWP